MINVYFISIFYIYNISLCPCTQIFSVVYLIMKRLNLKTLLLREWPTDQQQPYHLGTCCKCRIVCPILDLPSQNLSFHQIKDARRDRKDFSSFYAIIYLEKKKQIKEEHPVQKAYSITGKIQPMITSYILQSKYKRLPIFLLFYCFF